MNVTKWYLDLVGEDGAVVIAYAARVRWRRLRLAYSAVLQMSADGDVEERMTLRRFEEPRWKSAASSDGGRQLEWGNRALGVRGQWRPLRESTALELGAESSGQKLLAAERGEVRWQLLSGRAAGTWLDTRSGVERAGLGYVERLDLTLPPWDLPIDELRWGRFVSSASDAAWIEWRGPHPLRLAWRSGENRVTESPGDYPEAEAPPELGLALRDPVVLRDGRLASTVFQKIPVLRQSLPLRMLNSTETKWRSAGVMEDGAKGWAIHEVVRWG